MTGMRTAMGTAAGGGVAGFGGLRDGKNTEQLYSLIRDGKYHEAIDILATKQLEFPTSRAAQSLLAYCYYYVSDFQNALMMYERLIKMCPEVEEYKFYYAQSLFKGGLYEPALKACQNCADSPGLSQRVLVLQAAIKYEQDDLMNTKALIDQCPPEEADTLVNQACVMYKEAMAQGAEPTLYEKARLHFQEAMSKTGFVAELAYAIGLCHYQQKQYGPALKLIAEIIERGVREHPELSVGSQTEGIDVRSVGNSLVLKETALIEAFNLKAAIEFQMKNYDAAREALSDMPPRGEGTAARPCVVLVVHLPWLYLTMAAPHTRRGGARPGVAAQHGAHEHGEPPRPGLPQAQLPHPEPALPAGDLRQPSAALLQAPVLRPRRRRPRRECAPHLQIPRRRALRVPRRDAHGADRACRGLPQVRRPVQEAH